MAAKNKQPIVLDTRTVNGVTVEFRYYPVMHWYGWWASNGECWTGECHGEEAIARADYDDYCNNWLSNHGAE